MLTDVVESLINLFLKILPDWDIAVITVPETVLTIINMAWYFLPMETITSLLSLSVNITIFRITLAIIYRIKSFIPTLGN